MIIDWIAREGGIVLNWWLLTTAAGAAALPIAFVFLRALPDRGYTLARALGLLLVGGVFWLLGSFGFIRADADGVRLAWLLVALVALVVWLRTPQAIVGLREWWRENRTILLVGEIAFAGLLIAWAIVRAHQNVLLFTEKPMELAFLSSVVRGEVFPPADPWLSGYAISYYYFGYVIAGMLAKVSAIPSTVAFNMTISLWVALTGLGAYGVVVNLVRSRATVDAPMPARTPIVSGLIALVFVTLLSNAQFALVELPYQARVADSDYLAIWNLNERTVPLGSDDPQASNFDRWGNWWWFRAARVVSDRNLDGRHVEVIDEFPAFSFVLADIHPHVLSLPFTLLALGIAFHHVLRGLRPRAGDVIFYGVVIGGLIFLNTWDGGIYLILLLGAEALRRVIGGGGRSLHGGDVVDLALMGAQIAAVALVVYLPFLIAFRSQLGGILPNVTNPTQPGQFLIMFAPFLLLLLPYLALETVRAGGRFNTRLAIIGTAGIIGGLLLVMGVLVIAGFFLPAFGGPLYGFVDANGGWDAVIPELLTKRLAYLPTTLLLGLMLALVIGRLFARRDAVPDTAEAPDPLAKTPPYPVATGFVLLIVAAGAMLTLVPEFVYLRDNFATRMNTVFKFYYQAWVLFGVASAYAVYSLLADGRLRLPSVPLRAAYVGVLALVFSFGLPYVVLGVAHRTTIETGRAAGFNTEPLTLDGGGGYTTFNEYAMVRCLEAHAAGRQNVVVAEAVGGSYQGEFGRVATLTGIPTVYNWPGHQSQWRGGTFTQVAGSRDFDLDQLYGDLRWEIARDILRRYGIDYVVVGVSERNKYPAFLPAGEIKFQDNLALVCEFGESRVYHVTETALNAQLSMGGR